MNRRLIALALASTLSLVLAQPAPAAQSTTCPPTTGTVSGLSFSQIIGAAFDAVVSNFSGASPPATACSGASVKGQFWLDTSVTPNQLKQFDGASWVVMGALDSSNHLWTPPIGGGAAPLTAATSLDLCASPASVQAITGTTTIVSFGSNCVVGITKKVVFNSATPLTYNASSMILPGQRDYVASPGDVADALYLGAGNWRVAVSKIDGSAVTNPAVPLGTVLYGDYGTIPPKTVYGAGQGIARAAYPDYFAAVTRVQNGTLTAGNTTIAGVPNTSGLGAGMPLEGFGIQAGTTIVSVSPSSIVMSNPASTNGLWSFRAFPTGYGGGGDSTTVGVKNCKGRTLAGRDDAGGTPENLLTVAGSGINGRQINALGGSQSRLVDPTQLPNITLTATGSITVGALLAGGNGLVQSTAEIIRATQITANSNLSFDLLSAASASRITSLTSTGFNTMSANLNTVPQVGFPLVQPTAVAECVVVVLP